MTPEARAQRNAIETELESIAIIDRKVMVPMRDGKRMAADIYRPKDTSKKYPDHLRAHALQLQLSGTCATGAPRDMTARARSREARLCVRGDE